MLHRKWRVKRIVAFSILFLLTWFIHIYLLVPSDPPHHPGGTTSTTVSFLDALQKVAPLNRVVILAYVDCAALEIAENFYESSLHRHNIDNVLFVTADTECGDAMAVRHLPCHVYSHVDGGDIMNAHGDHIYEIFHLIATALSEGYTILYTDIDVVFFKNPLDHINCTDCDIAVMSDLDLGFMYARPTPRGMELFNYISQLSLKFTHLRQDVSRDIREAMKGFKVTWLPRQSFQGGHLYFELGLRTYYGQYPCRKCVVVQNNGLRSVPAKIYRLKESMLWVRDTGAYYSSETRKYIFYGNPLVREVYNIEELEKSELESALAIGMVLNRTVILPRFYCTFKHAHCGLISLYNVTAFDAAFRGMYREHVFLGNEKVPEVMRESQTEDYIIATVMEERALNQTSMTMPLTRLVPNNPDRGATSDEIQQWFGDIKDSVLCFHSLYSAFDRFTDPDTDAEFRERLKRGIQVADYHQ